MFTLEHVVPWGRSFDEYQAMFALSDADLDGRILGCGDGPASFNAIATQRGGTVISCDPIYRWGVAEMRARINDTYAEVIDQTRRNHDEFVWDTIRSVLELCRVAREVRVFPLLAWGGAPSPWVERCASALRAAAFDVSIERVPYEFQRGGNEMMRIGRPPVDGCLPLAATDAGS